MRELKIEFGINLNSVFFFMSKTKYTLRYYIKFRKNILQCTNFLKSEGMKKIQVIRQ